MKRITAMILFFLLAVGLQAAETWSLTILHSNDLHGMMLPFDYPGNLLALKLPAKDVGGLARRATLIGRVRRETDHPVVVVDCGDNFTRGPWHTKFYGAPEIEALNLMGYDLFCVGNNEFKATEKTDSQGIMLGLMRRSRFPWLAANLTVGETGVSVEGIHPFVVRDFGNVRVGFLGLTAPRAKDYAQTKGWTISDPIEAAKTWVPLARKECDLLIAVTHIGVDLDKKLAAEVPGIDAIVGGDSHTFLTKSLAVKGPAGRDVPIVQAGEQGVLLGRLNLTFEHAEGWKLTAFDGGLTRIDNTIPEDPQVKTLLDRYLAPAQVGFRFPAPAFPYPAGETLACSRFPAFRLAA